MHLLESFLPKSDRYAALLLYGTCLATCFNGYDAGIMTVILANDQFKDYYNIDANRTGLVAAIPWVATGIAQLFVGGSLASLVGRLWAIRLGIICTIVGVYVLQLRVATEQDQC